MAQDPPWCGVEAVEINDVLVVLQEKLKNFPRGIINLNVGASSDGGSSVAIFVRLSLLLLDLFARPNREQAELEDLVISVMNSR